MEQYTDEYYDNSYFKLLLEYGKVKLLEYYKDNSDKIVFQDERLICILEEFCKETVLPEIPSVKRIEEITHYGRQFFEAGHLLPLEYLIKIFKLDYFEIHSIIMGLLPELDRRFELVFSVLNQESKGHLLSVNLVIALYNHLELPNKYLVYFQDNTRLMRFFYSLHYNNEYSNLSAVLKLNKRILSLIIGREWEKLAWFMEERRYIPEEGEKNFSFFHKEVSNKILSIYRNKMQNDSSNSVFFHLYGPKGIGKHFLVKTFAKECNCGAIFIKSSVFEDITVYERNNLLNEILFECLVGQTLLCFVMDRNHKVNQIEHLILSIRDVREYIGVVFLIAENEQKDIMKIMGHNSVSIPITIPSRAEGLELWNILSKDYCLDSTVNMEQIADKFQLTPGQMKHILEAAQSKSWLNNKDSISKEILISCCYKEMEHQLWKKATKIDCIYDWKDLVLPKAQLTILKTACDQMKYRHIVYEQWGFNQKMNYGTGLSMIFTGSPGTGKTMASQVIANELDLELYKVELAAVVSKYIGETERNLNEIFDEAMKSQAILFFDEADVLFSKRTEVKDSNDKYNNMEAAFLLQKMEAYSGISILATNYIQNMDDAFRRRVKFLIDFPLPDMEYRKKLWESVFPKDLPLNIDIDFDYLARNFELSGSNIKNTAIHAAFLAASSGQNVGMEQLVKALKNEMTKNGKMLSKEDFGEYYMYANI